jgi:CRISPR-associated exonuclease Cas4
VEYLALLLLAAALYVLYLSRRQRRATGLPTGRVTYSDTGRWTKVEKPLYDPVSGLTGKPDYLVEENGFLIPVEVKSGRAPNLPHDSHIFQLAAYCLLVEATEGIRPPMASCATAIKLSDRIHQAAAARAGSAARNHARR